MRERVCVCSCNGRVVWEGCALASSRTEAREKACVCVCVCMHQLGQSREGEALANSRTEAREKCVYVCVCVYTPVSAE